MSDLPDLHRTGPGLVFDLRRTALKYVIIFEDDKRTLTPSKLTLVTTELTTSEKCLNLTTIDEPTQIDPRQNCFGLCRHRRPIEPTWLVRLSRGPSIGASWNEIQRNKEIDYENIGASKINNIKHQWRRWNCHINTTEVYRISAFDFSESAISFRRRLSKLIFRTTVIICHRSFPAPPFLNSRDTSSNRFHCKSWR